MKNMNLQHYIDKLDTYINKLAKANFMLTPKVCPTCHRLIIDKQELEFLFEVGECPRCDKSYGDALEERKYE